MRFISKQKLSEEFRLFKFERPINCGPFPGQFIAIKIKPNTEKTSFLIADSDQRSISIVVSNKSEEGKKLSEFKRNDEVPVLGPMGKPLKIKEYGNVCLVCEGAGLGPLYPISKAMKNAGNKVVVVAGFLNRKQKFWEKRFKNACDKFVTIIDKKNNITHGVVTEVHNWIRRKHFGFVLANCDPHIMREISRITKLRAKTYVLLTPRIHDGVGMCGSCRVTYKEEVRFACIDGPAFNAHKLNWDEVINRNRIWNTAKCKE